jgi:hypothetical protein
VIWAAACSGVGQVAASSRKAKKGVRAKDIESLVNAGVR